MFNVVLVEPEIPQNTGSIGRLCLATGCTLHLVEPLGFEIDNSRLKRAGLDYWEHLQVKIHQSLDSFWAQIDPTAQKLFVSKQAAHPVYDRKIQKGAYLFFGKETLGLPDSVLSRYSADAIRIPMFDARVRSLNLANAVSICVYEGIRQIKASF